MLVRKRHCLRFVLLLFACLTHIQLASAATDQDFIGKWQGTLNVSLTKLRLVIHVELEDQKLVAKMDSIDQGANGIPISEVKIDGDEVNLTVKVIRGEYSGTFDESKNKIDGTWKQGGLSLPLVLERTDEVVKLERPQEPNPPFPYDDEDVTFKNEAAGIELAGTLTLPRGEQANPAVILVSGSGPQDRDEAIMGHRPFWVLADYLTRRGVAVLRFDDRGFADSKGDFESATTIDFKDDVLAAFQFMKQHPRVDAQRIGICGHSEGGLIAPLAAVEAEDIDFIVLMAGPGVTGEEILYRQADLISRSMGADDEEVNRAVAMQKAIFSIIKSEPDAEVAKEKAEQVVAEFEANATDEEKEEIEAQRAMREAQTKLVFTPWFRFFLTHDPAPVLTKVKCPILALFGENDLQVDPEQNLPVIQQTLENAGHDNFHVQQFPKLNHLFQTSETGAVAEYSQIEETISPIALDAIGDWIIQQVGETHQ